MQILRSQILVVPDTASWRPCSQYSTYRNDGAMQRGSKIDGPWKYDHDTGGGYRKERKSGPVRLLDGSKAGARRRVREDDLIRECHSPETKYVPRLMLSGVHSTSPRRAPRHRVPLGQDTNGNAAAEQYDMPAMMAQCLDLHTKTAPNL